MRVPVSDQFLFYTFTTISIMDTIPAYNKELIARLHGILCTELSKWVSGVPYLANQVLLEMDAIVMILVYYDFTVCQMKMNTLCVMILDLSSQ